MRTTIEISDEQHLGLIDLAARRRLRGFSPLVQEAISDYLRAHGSLGVSDALAAEGSLTPEQAEQMKKSIDEAWATWTPA